MAAAEQSALNISERDRRAVKLIAKLSERELFGLECFIAGARAAGREQQAQAEAAKNAATVPAV